jgi:hypothetical protein
MLLSLAIAIAADTVDVPGVGDVPVDDAVRTCIEGQPIGALAEASPQRRPAFGVVLDRLLRADASVRQGYFGIESPWPTAPLDATYVGDELPWEPPSVVPACTAAGLEMVRRGLAIRQACDTSKTACRDAFPADEQVALRQALKSTKPKGRVDGFLEEVGRAGVRSFTSPRPLLERACAAPMQAGTALRFLDTDDLDAARLACVQLLVLVEGERPDLSRLPCDTAWRDIAALPVVESPTDLGVTDTYPEVQVADVLDKLSRADAHAGTCAAPWASAWRELDELWLDRQRARACDDDALPLSDRHHLCPNLLTRAEAACRASDLDQCLLLGQLHLEGVGTPADTRAALDVWQEACHGAHGPSCEAIAGRKELVQGWLDEALAIAAGEIPEGATPAQDALQLVVGFGDALGPEWIEVQAERLFEAAMAIEQAKVASDVLSLHGDLLGDEWSDEANLRLQKLEEKLEKAALGG